MAERSSREAQPLSKDKAFVVIGVGTMGVGIAAVAATAGHRVYRRDANEAALDKGLAQSIEIGQQIAAMPPLAVQASREAMRLGTDARLETGLALNRRCSNGCSTLRTRKRACGHCLEASRLVSTCLTQR